MRMHFSPRSRAFAVAAAMLAVAGCSSEFSRDPFTNPFQPKAPPSEVTNTVTPQPTPAVETQPIATAPVTAEPTYAPRTVPAAPAPSITAQPAPTPATTGTVTTRTGWTWEGGTPVTVQPGETIDALARRYGVPAVEILRANNLASAAQVQPGQRIVIPRYQQATTPAPAPTNRIVAPAPAPRASQAIVHIVAPRESLSSIARRYHKRRIEIAKANGLAEFATLKLGQRLTIPGTVATQPAAPKKPQQRVETKPAPTPVPENMALVKPTAPAPAPQLTGPPQFRWPVKGKVISAFGPKPNGKHNDGINLAVPEGTILKAAEDGVVAYAGNELKGYGNLVLIRHADGWVTAYAHNSELLVRRGETVKRGQTIARAGKTGGVDTPQLHFEIRKGSTPVDPTQHLANAG